MALTWANFHTMYRGPRTQVYAEATFDSSYAAGGETVNASDIQGLSSILMLIPSANSGYNVTYSKTNDTSGKLALYASQTPDTNSAVAVPVDSAVARDYSNITVACLIVGR